MTRRGVLAAALLALGGCGEREQTMAANEQAANVAAPVAEPVVVAGEPFWPGTWAASPALCAGGAWRFEEASVSTEGETSCKAESTRWEAADRAMVTMACVAEGRSTPEQWTMAKRSDGRLAVTRTGPNGFYADVALTRCR